MDYALPDWLDATDEYEAIWPMLSQSRNDSDEVVYHAWPQTDWREVATQADVSLGMPIWEAPFGRKVIDRLSGQLANNYLIVRETVSLDSATLPARNLADFSPIYTLDWLTQAEIINGEKSGEKWRGDRSANLRWNDPWGNPMIISSALFIAPRYGF